MRENIVYMCNDVVVTFVELIKVRMIFLFTDHFLSSLISAEDLQKNYEMVESEAYFEAYRHVLAGLQGKWLIQ